MNKYNQLWQLVKNHWEYKLNIVVSCQIVLQNINNNLNIKIILKILKIILMVKP